MLVHFSSPFIIARQLIAVQQYVSVRAKEGLIPRYQWISPKSDIWTPDVHRAMSFPDMEALQYFRAVVMTPAVWLEMNCYVTTFATAIVLATMES